MTDIYTTGSLAKIWAKEPVDDAKPDVVGGAVRFARDEVGLELYDFYRPLPTEGEDLYPIGEIPAHPRLAAGDILPLVEFSCYGSVSYRGPATVRQVFQKDYAFTELVVSLKNAWPERPSLLPDDNVKGAIDSLVDSWSEKVESIPMAYWKAVDTIGRFLVDKAPELQQLEMTLRRRGMSKKEAVREVASNGGKVLQTMRRLYEDFETIARMVPDDPKLQEHCIWLARRRLHPLILPAPFPSRVIHRPFGYPGDAFMVLQILDKERFYGDSPLAQLINAGSLDMALVYGHINRIAIIVRLIKEELGRLLSSKGKFSLLDVGCGPAAWLEAFPEADWAKKVMLHFLDSSPEALSHVEGLVKAFAGSKSIPEPEYQALDIMQLRGLHKDDSVEASHDIILCAGLFDYFQKSTAAKITRGLCRLLKPGGLLVITNVHKNNPSRCLMEHILDWKLILRDCEETLALAEGCDGTHTVELDDTGTNIILKIRKAA